MRNYSIYTLKTKLELTNLYQYLSEKDGSITNFVGFPIPLVALSAHIE